MGLRIKGLMSTICSKTVPNKLRFSEKVQERPHATISECHSRDRILHDIYIYIYVAFSSTYISCIIGLREVHAQAVSGNFAMYLGLGEYGNGPCLHSLHVLKTSARNKSRCRKRGVTYLAGPRCLINYTVAGRERSVC